MRLIRNDEIDPSLLQDACRRLNYVGGVFGLGQAIDDRSHSEIPEVFVILHRCVEKHDPAYDRAASSDLIAQESLATRRVEDIQGFAIANRNQRVPFFAPL